MAGSRTASVERRTGETDVLVTLALGGSGDGARETGVGFFDHMLDLLARHGALDLDVAVKGDLQTGSHHTVEDTGLAIGQALDRALGDRAGITRYGWAAIPMDEVLGECAIDVSGRPFLRFAASLPPGVTGGFEHELCEEFFRAVATTARLTVHLRCSDGGTHHQIEALFKAFARALRAAVAIDPTAGGAVPSTKGTLTS